MRSLLGIDSAQTKKALSLGMTNKYLRQSAVYAQPLRGLIGALTEYQPHLNSKWAKFEVEGRPIIFSSLFSFCETCASNRYILDLCLSPMRNRAANNLLFPIFEFVGAFDLCGPGRSRLNPSKLFCARALARRMQCGHWLPVVYSAVGRINKWINHGSWIHELFR